MNIGERIFQLRKALKLTQAHFAEPLGVDRSYIAALENEGGNKQPSETLINLISLHYGVSVTWLKEGKGEIFISLEDVLAKIIACHGEQAVFHVFNTLIRERKERNPAVAETGAIYRVDTGDPDIDRMITTLYDIWSTSDDKLKAWASIQFDRAIPADVVEEAQKKQQETTRQSEAG